MIDLLIGFTVFFLPWSLLALLAAWVVVFVVNRFRERRLPDVAIIWVWAALNIPIWNHLMR